MYRDTTFPVGLRDLPALVWPRIGVHHVVPEATGATQGTLSQEADQMLVEGAVKGSFKVINGKWVNISPGYQEPAMGVDLGNLLGDVNKILDIKDRLFPKKNGGAAPIMFHDEGDFQEGGVFDLPGGDIVSNPPVTAHGPSAVYKKVCGRYKWVIPKRRRRKQLVTKSDAAGLAVLKGIVGNGVVMQTWIATHG